MKTLEVKLGKCEANPHGLADLEYEVIRIEWQQETLITNSNPILLGSVVTLK